MPARRAGLDVPVLDDETRRTIDVHLPSYGTSQNPIDSTAQGVHKLGYAAFAQMAAQSPLIDGVIVVVTARRSAFLEGDLAEIERRCGRRASKPVFMWTYTLPSERSVEILNEAGISAVHQRAGLRAHFAGAGGLPASARSIPDKAAAGPSASPCTRQCARAC